MLGRQRRLLLVPSDRKWRRLLPLLFEGKRAVFFSACQSTYLQRLEMLRRCHQPFACGAFDVFFFFFCFCFFFFFVHVVASNRRFYGLAVRRCGCRRRHCSGRCSGCFGIAGVASRFTAAAVATERRIQPCRITVILFMGFQLCCCRPSCTLCIYGPICCSSKFAHVCMYGFIRCSLTVLELFSTCQRHHFPERCDARVTVCAVCRLFLCEFCVRYLCTRCLSFHLCEFCVLCRVAVLRCPLSTLTFVLFRPLRQSDTV